MDPFIAITLARRALFEAGGMKIERHDGRGRMAPLAPVFKERADAYNALADIHRSFPDPDLASLRPDFRRMADLHAGA